MSKSEKNAIFRVMVAFTKRGEGARDEFVDGLTTQQYAALRDLNVMRIDSGDDRIPEDYVLRGKYGEDVAEV